MTRIKHIAHLIAVGDWIVGEDLFELKVLAPYKKAAMIHDVAITGSAALGDTGLEIKQGEEVMFRGFNSKLGNAATACIEDFPKHRQRANAVRKGKEWSAFPTVTATTNGVYLHLWMTV